jgi:NCAIR mutase (PurE)-related protein
LYAVNSLSVVGVGGFHRLITRVQREKKRRKGSQDNCSGAAGEVAKESGVEEEQQ